MIVGQKVVCINDTFPQWVKAIYAALPVKGKVYVIRQVRLGFSIANGRQVEGEVCVYLIGMHNPGDPAPPHHERGFNAERFRPLDEMQKRDTETVADAIGKAYVPSLEYAESNLKTDSNSQGSLAADAALVKDRSPYSGGGYCTRDGNLDY